MSISQKPIIGISGNWVKNQYGSQVSQVGLSYVTAIQHAGGIPIAIPTGINLDLLNNLLLHLSGILIPGGGDIDPQLFDGTPHPRVYGISSEHDQMEISLVKQAILMNKPLLAICRGIQVLNVACGGSLFTHIDDQKENAIKHDWYPGYPRDKYAHHVHIMKPSKLHDILQRDDIPVNSLHHQGISTIGKGLSVTAIAEDGLIEGLEVDGLLFGLGVQWHPESMPDDPNMQVLFQAFINACK